MNDVSFVTHIAWNKDGLLPVITQHGETYEVLMMAWMNQEALHYTLQHGVMCYWSRSRQRLWIKGETSGQIQRWIDLRLDCDNDCLLALVHDKAVACHTGRRSCFYKQFNNITGKIDIITEPIIQADLLYPSS